MLEEESVLVRGAKRVSAIAVETLSSYDCWWNKDKARVRDVQTA